MELAAKVYEQGAKQNTEANSESSKDDDDDAEEATYEEKDK